MFEFWYEGFNYIYMEMTFECANTTTLNSKDKFNLQNHGNIICMLASDFGFWKDDQKMIYLNTLFPPGIKNVNDNNILYSLGIKNVNDNSLLYSLRIHFIRLRFI